MADNPVTIKSVIDKATKDKLESSKKAVGEYTAFVITEAQVTACLTKLKDVEANNGYIAISQAVGIPIDLVLAIQEAREQKCAENGWVASK